MKINIYPFLVASSKKLDYTVVLCPDFLSDSPQRYNTLHKFANERQPNKTFHRIAKFTNQNLYIFYQSRIAEDSNKNILKDEFGRPLYMLYGFVTLDELDNIPNNVFETILTDYIKPRYKAFYDSNFFSKPFVSQLLDLELDESNLIDKQNIEKQSDLSFDFSISLKKTPSKEEDAEKENKEETKTVESVPENSVSSESDSKDTIKYIAITLLGSLTIYGIYLMYEKFVLD